MQHQLWYNWHYNNLYTDCQIECVLRTNDYFVDFKVKVTKYITESFEN